MIGVNPASGQRAAAVERCCTCSTAFARRYDDPHAELRAGARHHADCEALRRGAPVDLVFQSIAGTEAANASFGVNLALLDEARAGGAGTASRPSATT